MFPIFTTALALILCLLGADLQVVEGAEGVSPLSTSLLLIIPLGELLVIIARRKKSRVGLKALKLIYTFFTTYPLAAFAAAILFLGWSRFPEGIGLSGCLLLEKGLLIASYLALSTITRIWRNRFALAMKIMSPHRSRSELVLALKGEVTVVIPFMIFMLFNDLIDLSEELNELFSYLPFLFWGSLLVLFLGIAYIMPWIIKAVWRLKPLSEDSGRRQALFRFMDKQEFKARDILEWPTGGILVNAAIIGLTGRSRHIVFTDAMLRHLTLSELKAVMAHEIGHGKNRHLLIYLFFSAAFVFGISLLENLLTPMADLHAELDVVMMFIGPAVLLYWWVVFGFLSRRFEMEADIFGADAVKNPALFMHTLNKVAQVAGVMRRRKSWRHFSIDRRVASLMKVFFEDPPAAVLFWRKMKWVRSGLLSLSVILFLFFSMDMAGDSMAGAGLLAMKNGDYDGAEEYLNLASRFPGGERHRWSLVTLFLKANRTYRADDLLMEMTAQSKANATPEFLCPLMMELALALLEKGEEGRCMDVLRRALELFPGSGEMIELNRNVLRYIQGDPGPLKAWLETKRGAEEGEDRIPFLIPGDGEKDGSER